MLVHLLGGRSLLRSGLTLQRLGVPRRCFCAAQSDRCPDTPQQQADMIRGRAQIKRVLCVAEKNDAAKGIAEIMSNGRSRRVSHVFSPTVTLTYKTPTTVNVNSQHSAQTINVSRWTQNESATINRFTPYYNVNNKLYLHG